VLLVRKGARWRAPLPVDDRADSRVSGFENVPAALAAAAALQARTAEREEVNARQFALVDRIRERVAATVPDVEVVGDPVSRLPHLVTFSCLYVDGEALVTELDREGFGVASGSACTASTLTPSHVLEAMGALTHGNVRVSLTRDTTEAAVERFLDVLPGVVSRLRERAGVR
jgi:cysteine desulfurase